MSGRAFSRGMRIIRYTMLCLVCALSALLPAVAEDARALKPSDQPVEVKSRKLTAKMVPNGAELTFEGKVHMKQEDMVLSCDKLVGYYEDEKPHGEGARKRSPKDMPASVKSATASGSVRVTKGDLRAEAGRAVLDNVKRTVTLSDGPPRVWQGPHVLSADSIIIFLDENRAELVGGDEGGVKVILNPGKSKKEKDNSREK